MGSASGPERVAVPGERDHHAGGGDDRHRLGSAQQRAHGGDAESTRATTHARRLPRRSPWASSSSPAPATTPAACPAAGRRRRRAGRRATSRTGSRPTSAVSQPRSLAAPRRAGAGRRGRRGGASGAALARRRARRRRPAAGRRRAGAASARRRPPGAGSGTGSRRGSTCAGEQHDQPVDADAETAGRRQAVLERAEVVLVDVARLGVAGRLGARLGLEARALVDRVVELAVGVGELAPVDDRPRSARPAWGRRDARAPAARPRADGRCTNVGSTSLGSTSSS